jgi:hypothetical protein
LRSVKATGLLTGRLPGLLSSAVTRLIWVVIFALLIGALVIVSLKSLPGTRVNQRLIEAEQARETLSRMFPDSRFRIQFSTPNSGVRNLVVTVD